MNLKNNNMSKRKNRYFLVFYNGSCNVGMVSGCCDFTTNGFFLNLKQTINDLMKVQERNVLSITITNIIELTESDFSDWKV